MSCKVLIECGISSLPVNLNLIVNHYDIGLLRYSQCSFLKQIDFDLISQDGFITKINGKKIIFINDKIKTRGRRRFTVGHELGHCFLGHPLDNILTKTNEINPIETQANVFARDLLAPACVLDALNVNTAREIMLLCDISMLSAEIRLKRLKLLRKRGLFLKSYLENQVYNQFKDYIKHILKTK